MRISRFQPVAVILPTASQKKSGELSSPDASLGERVVLQRRAALARNICAVLPSLRLSTITPP